MQNFVYDRLRLNLEDTLRLMGELGLDGINLYHYASSGAGSVYLYPCGAAEPIGGFCQRPADALAALQAARAGVPT